MTETVMRTQQTLVIGNGIQVFVEHLLGVHDGSDLQQVELTRAVIVQIAGKLNLHRTLHLVGTVFLSHLQQFWQGEHPMLEHTAEGDHLTPTLIDTITDNLVGGVIGRGDIGQRTVFRSPLHTEVLDVEAVVHLEVIADMGHVEGIETGLRLSQGRLHLRGLEHLCRMVGRHAECLSAVDDILTQSERQ